MNIRIGNGYDVHRFTGEPEEGASIRLAGVDVPHPYRLIAHSDGDVAIHALCDALLGALALGDIGRHFPDTDPDYKGADSLALLAHVRGLVEGRGWRPLNLDLTVVAQAPRLAPHVQRMRETLAGALELELDAVSLKATTTEGLGFTGRREGIAAYAVVLLGK